MKLDDVQDMESANEYLEQYPIAHTPLPQWANKCLIHGSSLKNNDCTVCYKGKIYQIIPMFKRTPAVKKCTVKKLFQVISPSPVETAFSMTP